MYNLIIVILPAIQTSAGVVINFAMAVDPNGKIISMNVHRYSDTIRDVNTNFANKNCTVKSKCKELVEDILVVLLVLQ